MNLLLPTHTYGWRCESETRVPSSRGLVKQYNQELCISSNSSLKEQSLRFLHMRDLGSTFSCDVSSIYITPSRFAELLFTWFRLSFSGGVRGRRRAVIASLFNFSVNWQPLAGSSSAIICIAKGLRRIPCPGAFPFRGRYLGRENATVRHVNCDFCIFVLRSGSSASGSVCW